jgi:3-methyladenine DNA glycosylase Tag
MEPPKQITPTKLADYLEHLTKPVFEGGINWKIIEAKWPGFQVAFQGFDPETVATLTPDDLDALSADTRIVRNRRKIEATVHNAQTMLAIEQEFGSFQNYLKSQGEFWDLVKDMKKRFKHVGDFGAFYFLYVVGEPVPEHHEFRAKLLEGAKK